MFLPLFSRGLSVKIEQCGCFTYQVGWQEETGNYLIKDFVSKKGQRRLPGCHLRLGKNWWWRGTRSFGRGCCLPSCRGKKQTVVIYICLPHFSETFAFFRKSIVSIVWILDLLGIFVPQYNFQILSNIFKWFCAVFLFVFFLLNFDFTTLCLPKMTTTMLKSNCRREYKIFLLWQR